MGGEGSEFTPFATKCVLLSLFSKIFMTVDGRGEEGVQRIQTKRKGRDRGWGWVNAGQGMKFTVKLICIIIFYSGTDIVYVYVCICT